MPTTTMRERPILFSSPMIRAILSDSKTQTRRVIKPQPQKGDHHPDQWLRWNGHVGGMRTTYHSNHRLCEARNRETGELLERTDSYIPLAEWLAEQCPYGVPGDRLWVRETFKIGWTFKHGHGLFYQADPATADGHPRGDGLPFHCFNGCCNGPGVREGYDWLCEKYGCDFSTEPWRPSIFMPRWASRISLEITAVRAERLHDITEADAIAEGFNRDLCGQVLREAAGPARMEFGRWLEMPDGSESDGYLCLDCAEKEAKKRRARVCGWNDCFESDHAPSCEKCGVMLHHSLTRYGIKTELGLTDDEATRIAYTPAEGDSALALSELAEGMGDWSDEYLGRLAQIGFGTAWNKLNAKRGHPWSANDWVWVVEFRRLTEDSQPQEVCHSRFVAPKG